MKSFSGKLAAGIASLHLATVLVGIGASANALTPGSFVPTGSMTTGRAAHTATRVHGGKVLVVGGYGRQGGDLPLASAELYDPSTGTFSATGSMTATRAGHTATLLLGCKVLVAGGEPGGAGVPTLATAELYVPSTPCEDDGE